jgi:hypothetical protein
LRRASIVVLFVVAALFWLDYARIRVADDCEVCEGICLTDCVGALLLIHGIAILFVAALAALVGIHQRMRPTPGRGDFRRDCRVVLVQQAVAGPRVSPGGADRCGTTPPHHGPAEARASPGERDHNAGGSGCRPVNSFGQRRTSSLIRVEIPSRGV